MPSLRVHDPRRGEAPSPLDGQVSPLALHSSALHWFRCHTPSRTNTHTSPRPVRISTLSLKSLLTHKRGSVDWFHPTTSGHIRAYLLRPQSHFLLVLSGGLPPLILPQLVISWGPGVMTCPLVLLCGLFLLHPTVCW